MTRSDIETGAIGIWGTGSYVPDRVVPNEEIAPIAGVTAQWIEERTQIVRRRYAAPHEATSDLAAHAARRALNRTGLAPADVDYLIIATSTPDSPQPPTAALVQHAIGAHDAAAFDVNAVCSGFVHAVAIAHALLLATPGTRALVAGADVYSRIIDRSDRRTAALFGDGAGAAVLGPVPGDGIIAAGLHTRGDHHGLIGVPAGGSRLPPSHRTIDAGEHYFRMSGREVTAFVLEHVPLAVKELMDRARLPVSAVRHVVPHQPNGNLLDRLTMAAGLSGATTHKTLRDLGNLGAASIPLTLDVASRSGAIADHDLVLLAGFGGGMAIGTCLLQWCGTT